MKTELLASVPSADLYYSEIEPGKPAVFAGKEPVLRCRDTASGRAYAHLVIGAVKALQKTSCEASIDATVAPDEPSSTISLKAQMQTRIDTVLKLQPAFQGVPVTILTKLIYAALEPLINPVANEVEQSASITSPVPKAGTKEVAAIRTEAVGSFCNFLLAHADSHELPSDDALSMYANNWDQTMNVGGSSVEVAQ